MGALAEKAKGGREEEEEESWKDLCSAILCGHHNLLENFFGPTRPLLTQQGCGKSETQGVTED